MTRSRMRPADVMRSGASGLRFRHRPQGRQTIECNYGDERNKRSHASPPARSASGALLRPPELRPSICLYHDIKLATATMIKMPAKLMSV